MTAPTLVFLPGNMCDERLWQGLPRALLDGALQADLSRDASISAMAQRTLAAVDRIVAACVAAARPFGMFVSRADDVPLWRAKGVRFFLLESDHVFLRSGAATLRRSAGL